MNLTDPLCLDNIKTCCAASQLAYTQPTITDAASGESVLIQDCGDSTLVAFPGTHDLRDVLRDIDCLRIVTMIFGQPCSVHAGFNRAHNALIEKIVLTCSVKEVPAPSTTAVVSPSPWGPRSAGSVATPSPLNGERAGVRGENTQAASATPFFITGHSKGAAVARRCALALLEKDFPVAGLITFGEPRGGDARYAKICDTALSTSGGATVGRAYPRAVGSRSLRITNAADPVPWLPAWLAGNRHCGPEAWFPPDHQLSPINHQLVYAPRLWYQLLLNSAEIFRAWRLKDLAPLADHHIDNYLTRINAL